MGDPTARHPRHNKAEVFAQLRDAHAREVTEDYVEMIADLIEEEGEARSVALAERFGVTAATVNNTIKRLERDGFVTSRPYRSIFLTEKGEALAKKCRERHQIVYSFLVSIGIAPEVAEFDAEGIEHHVSEETLRVFKNAINL
ncbi:manganese-binding transcriptional regulator MntR [Thalassospira sp. SN3W]|uniref:manganese-binding transcriptional regulator MntR n=1 Tax=Thalassospira sp. SN3W TaxID=3035476 RepID=UPI00311B0CAB